MSKIRESLAQKVLENINIIEDWFKENYNLISPLLYTSVDIRNSGYKLSPVDTNIFPAGFNNLNDYGKQRAINELKVYLTNYFPGQKRAILIGESHTRNLFYLDNLINLKEIIEKSGIEVVCSMIDLPENKIQFTAQSGRVIELKRIIKSDNKILCFDGFEPDFVMLNNDLTNGVPEILQNLTQHIIPSTKLGWYVRRKSKHFEIYNNIARDICNQIQLDPFFVTTIYEKCGTVNFKAKQGLECVALKVEKIIHTLKEKYKFYNIEDEPYAFIKADNGTYGMGIMTVRSGEEVYEMNKKLRNKMDTIKGGITNTEVIIQEGIKTIDNINGAVAEPMIYLIGGEPVGCIYRVNNEKDEFGNLNAQGMHFEQNICQQMEKENSYRDNPKFLALWFVSKLASLAAAKEIN